MEIDLGFSEPMDDSLPKSTRPLAKSFFKKNLQNSFRSEKFRTLFLNEWDTLRFPSTFRNSRRLSLSTQNYFVATQTANIFQGKLFSSLLDLSLSSVKCRQAEFAMTQGGSRKIFLSSSSINSCPVHTYTFTSVNAYILIRLHLASTRKRRFKFS